MFGVDSVFTYESLTGDGMENNLTLSMHSVMAGILLNSVLALTVNLQRL